MKAALAILACGLAVAATVYGALRLSGSQKPGPADPWIGAFRDEGLQVALASTSSEPGREFYIMELRKKLRAETYSGARTFEYVIEDVKVQITTFPFESRIEEVLHEGTHYEYRPKDKEGNSYHYCRIGRHVLVMFEAQKFGIHERRPVPRKLAARIFAAFAEGAER